MKEDAKSRRRADGVDVDRAGTSSSSASSLSRGATRVETPTPLSTQAEPTRLLHVFSFAADEVAMAALAARKDEPVEARCDACDVVIDGEPAGKGLFYWFRGDELRFDEPPLCGDCAAAITHAANRAWDIEEEEG